MSLQLLQTILNPMARKIYHAKFSYIKITDKEEITYELLFLISATEFSTTVFKRLVLVSALRL